MKGGMLPKVALFFFVTDTLKELLMESLRIQNCHLESETKSLNSIGFPSIADWYRAINNYQKLNS